MFLQVAAYRAVRRALEHDQHRPPRGRVPFWRLLLEEIALLARRVGRWRVTGVVIAVFGSFLIVEVALSTETPGPALSDAWRWIVAAAFAIVVLGTWAVIHAVRRTRADVAEPVTPSSPRR